jgi:hypothetical protein
VDLSLAVFVAIIVMLPLSKATCCVVLCCVVLCRVVLCYVVLCCVVLCRVVLYCVVLCGVVSHCVVSCCVVSCCVASCRVMLCRVVSVKSAAIVPAFPWSGWHHTLQCGGERTSIRHTQRSWMKVGHDTRDEDIPRYATHRHHNASATEPLSCLTQHFPVRC